MARRGGEDRKARLLERAKAARAAHEELRAAFAEVVDRRNEGDPRTKRWLDAIQRWRLALDLAYPDALREVDDGARDIGTLHSADIGEFLETDPIYFRSGYIKQRLLRAIKKRDLEPAHVILLQDAVLHVVSRRDCREFREYCRAAATVDDDRLRRELADIAASGSAGARRRASWVIHALDRAVLTRAGEAMRQVAASPARLE
jgi:hypothetical protein